MLHLDCYVALVADLLDSSSNIACSGAPLVVLYDFLSDLTDDTHLAFVMRLGDIDEACSVIAVSCGQAKRMSPA